MCGRQSVEFTLTGKIQVPSFHTSALLFCLKIFRSVGFITISRHLILETMMNQRNFKKERMENWNVEVPRSNFQTSIKAIQVFNSNRGFFLWHLTGDPFDICYINISFTTNSVIVWFLKTDAVWRLTLLSLFFCTIIIT